jgi:1-hydroxycarotenoid 3,4-desaturase
VSRVIVVGAGMGGLAAATDLARLGHTVTVLERAAAPGGKMRALDVQGAAIDAGPTVFTMRWVFESLFRDAGLRLDDELELVSADILARHAWSDGSRLDLHADRNASERAIREFAGARDAAGYRDFCKRSAELHAALRDPFMSAQRPGPLQLVARLGPGGLAAMWRTTPWTTLWRSLAENFDDARMRQLFGRYATYVGSSPFAAPATLMLIAHVEQDGVCLVRGGMARVAMALERAARSGGAHFRYGAHVAKIKIRDGRAIGVELADGESLAAEAIVFNGDANALHTGLLGESVTRAVPGTRVAERSLSAITWCVNARTRGFPLEHHNVFFGDDYAAEFAAIFGAREIAHSPTVYLCAQDRGKAADTVTRARERMLLLVNAPADGDQLASRRWDFERVERHAFELLSRCGLEFERSDGDCRITRPEDFDAAFPGTGGALYGRANHGAFTSFARPASRSKIGGLYLAGGSVHPGPGIPMATLSGRLAAARLHADLG